MRYTDFQLPPYKHIPGVTKRPTDSHYGIDLDAIAADDDIDLRETPGYLYGIDLINGGWFFEAHGVLEQFWLNITEPEKRRVVQALIQFSVALSKLRKGEERAFEGMMNKARGKLHGIDGVVAGLSISKFRVRIEGILENKTWEDPLIVLED